MAVYIFVRRALQSLLGGAVIRRTWPRSNFTSGMRPNSGTAKSKDVRWQNEARFFFPLLSISLLAPPKTGSTSVLTSLVALERGSLTELPPEKVGSIHQEAKRFQGFSEAARLKVAIVRNPFDRAASFFVDKWFLARDEHYRSILHNALGVTRPEKCTLSEARLLFEAALSLLLADEGFRTSDGHWVPQKSFFRHSETFDQIVQTHEISSFLTPLLSKAAFNEDYALNRTRNRTPIQLKKSLWTAKSIDLVRQVYAADFDLLQGHGHAVESPIVSEDSPENLVDTVFYRSISSPAV